MPLTPLSKYIWLVLAVNTGNGARSAANTSDFAASSDCRDSDTSKLLRAASSTWGRSKRWVGVCAWAKPAHNAKAEARAVVRAAVRICVCRRGRRFCRMLIPRLSLTVPDQLLTLNFVSKTCEFS